MPWSCQPAIMLKKISRDIHAQRSERGDPAQRQAQHCQPPERAAVEAEKCLMTANQYFDIRNVIEKKHSKPDPAHCDDRERQIVGPSERRAKRPARSLRRG